MKGYIISPSRGQDEVWGDFCKLKRGWGKLFKCGLLDMTNLSTKNKKAIYVFVVKHMLHDIYRKML